MPQDEGVFARLLIVVTSHALNAEAEPFVQGASGEIGLADFERRALRARRDRVLKDGIEQPAGEGGPPVVLRTFAAKPPVDADINSDAIRVVQEALYDATHDANYGTSYPVFGFYPIPIAGKTGTAEKYVTLPKGYLGIDKPFSRLMNQSWWCGYGPYDDPELVVCALIENGGHGGEVAAPVALKVFEQYFHTPAPDIGTIYSD